MARMVLMCGVAGAGKSTYARCLEDDGFVRLSIDTEAWRGGHTVHPLPLEVKASIVARQQEQLIAALNAGRDVVVDYSFHARSTRDAYRAIAGACGASTEVVYFDVPRAELLRRLAARSKAGPGADTVVVPVDLLDAYIAGFEWPQSDEVDVTVWRAN